MCVAVPGRVIALDGARATVEIGGVNREVGVIALPDLKPGEYVLVSLGLALERLSEEEAESLQELWADLMSAFDYSEEIKSC